MKKSFFLVSFFFVFLFSLLFWFVFFSPFFQIEKIEVQPKEIGNIENCLSRKKFFKIIDISKNILFFDESWLEYLKTSEIKKIEVKKHYLQRKIEIIFQKRKPVLVWCLAKKKEEKKCFSIDRKGKVFKETSYSLGLNEIIVNDISRERVSLLEKVVSEREIEEIKKIFSHFSSFEKKEFIWPGQEFYEIELVLGEGPKIFFSLKEPIEYQLKVFDKFSSQRDMKKLDYIDLRSLPRIYYHL